MERTIDGQYIELLKRILSEGQTVENRRRETTRLHLPFAELEWMDSDTVPILQARAIPFKSIVNELVWFLRGPAINGMGMNKERLNDLGTHIWDDDYAFYKSKGKAEFKGDCGRIYGCQWRDWGNGGDQLYDLYTTMLSDISSSRMLVSAWNYSDLRRMSLPPCHWAFQMVQVGDGLAIQWYQRSVDTMLGLPFNVASYWLLGKLLCAITNIPFKGVRGVLTNVHIYGEHVEYAKELINGYSAPEAQPRLVTFNGTIARLLGALGLNGKTMTHKEFSTFIDALAPSVFVLKNYEPQRKMNIKMVGQKR